MTRIARLPLRFSKQTRRYDGTDDYGKRGRDATDHSAAQTNTATPTDSSVTGSPDSTDYTSDEYLRLPDKISPNVPCPMPTKVSTTFLLRNVSLRRAWLRLMVDARFPSGRERFVVGVPGPKQSESLVHRTSQIYKARPSA